MLSVTNADWANSNGEYMVVNMVVEWAPDRPVYKHIHRNRHIFWNDHGLGWSIGKLSLIHI